MHQAIIAADFAAIDCALGNGAHIDSANNFGETGLILAIDLIDDKHDRFAVVAHLLKHGANPSITDDGGCNALFSATLRKDAKLINILIQHGASPDIKLDGGEPLYEWAEFTYRYDLFDLHLPEEPAENDLLTELTWLNFLDRLARKYHKPRPDYLFLLYKNSQKSIS